MVFFSKRRVYPAFLYGVTFLKNACLWALFFALFFILFLPNIVLFWRLDVGVVGFFDSPVLFIWDMVEIIGLAHPFLLIVLFELFLFALVSRVIYWFLINLFPYLLLPLETAYVFTYEGVSSPHILAVIAETNMQEFVALVSWFKCILIVTSWLFIGICAYIFSRRQWGWRHRSRWWFASAFGALLVVNAWSHSGFDKSFEDFVGEDANHNFRFKYGLEELIDTYPLGIPLRFIRYFDQMDNLKKSLSEIENYESIYKRDFLYDGREVYVVVLGESSRSDRWSINGYSRDTTPELKKYNVYSYTNAVSASAATRTSVPVILSRTKVDDLVFARYRHSWISDFKSQGFKVYWYSTQMPVGDHDTSVGIYAALADETEYLNVGRYQIKGEYDDVLLKKVSRVLESSDNKILIVLHTLGSHFPYAYRYPEEFAKWKPVQEGREENILNASQAVELGNSYDNSILYTDYVLSRLLGLLSKERYAAMWYMSDHGQSLFDKNCSMAGHGFYSFSNFHIPVVFWASPRYLKTRGDIASGLDVLMNKRVYAGDFYDTLLDTAGFDGEWNSFLSSGYQPSSSHVTVSGDNTVNIGSLEAETGCDGK